MSLITNHDSSTMSSEASPREAPPLLQTFHKTVSKYSLLRIDLECLPSVFRGSQIKIAGKVATRLRQRISVRRNGPFWLRPSVTTKCLS